ncbi:MAG: ABC transporter permease subunit [Gammaproteobacteria bacterium]
MIATIAGHELRTQFLSPLAWTLLSILQFLFAFQFLIQVDTFAQLQPQLAEMEGGPGLTDIVVTRLFGNAGIILLLVTPLLTMRLICEERRNKTLSLLLSAPVDNSDIIIGKYLGCTGLVFLIVLLTSLMPLSLLSGGFLDFGKLITNILALLLLVGAFIAAGLYMSCISGHPIIAAMASFGLLLLLWILDWSAGMENERGNLFEYLSILRHFQNIQSGLISSVDIMYFLLFTLTFIVLSIRRLDSDRLQK